MLSRKATVSICRRKLQSCAAATSSASLSYPSTTSSTPLTSLSSLSSSCAPTSLVIASSRRFLTERQKRQLTHEKEVVAYKPINIDVLERKDHNIYTLTEYMEMDETDSRLSTNVKDKISEKLDNPFWLLWGLAIVSIATMAVVIGIRIREENKRFDPNLQTVKILDNDDGPQIGGPFKLTDVNGNTVTNEDLKGKWLYIYFGFVNCPDICPEEMRKMSKLVRNLDKRIGKDYWQPIFITVDPKRDTKEKLKEYLSEFHPRILGLTGTFEETDAAARNYRVYYAIPDEPGMTESDYLIDHSIVMYLMDPEGKFVDYTTKEFTWNESYTKLLRRMMDYEREKAQNGKTDYNKRVANVSNVVVEDNSEEVERTRKEQDHFRNDTVPMGMRKMR